MSEIQKKPDGLGTLHGSRALFFRNAVGEMIDKETGEPTFELTTSVAQSVPIIQHLGTGRSWTISWAELVELAEKAGVADPDFEERPVESQESKEAAV